MDLINCKSFIADWTARVFFDGICDARFTIDMATDAAHEIVPKHIVQANWAHEFDNWNCRRLTVISTFAARMYFNFTFNSDCIIFNITISWTHEIIP